MINRLHLQAPSGRAMFDSAARLLSLAFGLGAVLLAAHWLTELTAPRLVAELPASPMVQPEAGGGVIGRLFATAAVQTEAVEGLHLTGVFSGARGGGFATIRTRNGEVHAFRGDQVAPGIVLKEIEGDRVILLAAGADRELKLAADSAVPAAVPPPRASVPARLPPAAQAVQRTPQPTEPERE